MCEDSIVFYCILTLSTQLKQLWYVSILPDFRPGRTSGYSQKHSCSSQFSFTGHVAILEWYWICAKINISVCINAACEDAWPKFCHIFVFRAYSTMQACLLPHYSFFSYFWSFQMFFPRHSSPNPLVHFFYRFLPYYWAIQRANYIPISAIVM